MSRVLGLLQVFIYCFGPQSIGICSYLDEIKHPLLLQGTIEEKIYQRQTAKQGLSGTVADARETVKVEFSRDELKVSIQSDWLFLTFVSYV